MPTALSLCVYESISRSFIKKMTPKDKHQENEMLREYDFHAGKRGKHARAYNQGHTVVIHQSDGNTLVQQFPPQEGAGL